MPNRMSCTPRPHPNPNSTLFGINKLSKKRSQGYKIFLLFTALLNQKHSQFPCGNLPVCLTTCPRGGEADTLKLCQVWTIWDWPAAAAQGAGRRGAGDSRPAWEGRRRRSRAAPQAEVRRPARLAASVGPPHGLLEARGRRHVGGGVAVAALGLHHVALAREAGVEQRRTGGGVGAGRQDARRRPLAADHGELVGASRGAVVEVVGGRAGLEGAALRLRRARVGRRQVRVVACGRAHGRHADADARRDGRRGVGEGAGVVHARVWDGG